MLACLKMGRLEPPFDAHPKDGRLDQLPPHALFAIKTSSEARRLERAAGPTGDWVTDPGVPGARLAGGAAGGSPGLGFKSSKYTAARGGAPIPGVSLGRNAKTLEEMLRRSSDDADVDGERADAAAGRSSPSRRVKDVLEIKGDMRDWLGKGAKGFGCAECGLSGEGAAPQPVWAPTVRQHAWFRFRVVEVNRTAT